MKCYYNSCLVFLEPFVEACLDGDDIKIEHTEVILNLYYELHKMLVNHVECLRKEWQQNCFWKKSSNLMTFHTILSCSRY